MGKRTDRCPICDHDDIGFAGQAFGSVTGAVAFVIGAAALPFMIVITVGTG